MECSRVAGDIGLAGGGGFGHIICCGCLGLKDTELVRVLTGRAQDSVRVLIPDANVEASGFHDVTLVNMADAARPPVSVGDLGLLRRQWPVSIVAGMSLRQTELELMRHACKERFRGAQTRCCPYCSTNMKHDMTHHVSSFHLDLCQIMLITFERNTM